MMQGVAKTEAGSGVRGKRAIGRNWPPPTFLSVVPMAATGSGFSICESWLFAYGFPQLSPPEFRKATF